MMFQYTHEVIFNSLTMPDGSKRLVRNGVSTGPLTVKRGGEYWKAFIQDQRVYKTPGHVGRYEVLKIDVAKFAAAFPAREDETSFMAAGTYQLSLFVKLLDPHALYEFGYPNYKSFGRHILIGFDVVAGDTAATVAAKVYESLEMAIRKEEMLVGGLDESGDVAVVGEFEENATVVGIRANHYALRFDTVGLALYDETTCNSCIGEYLPTVDIFTNSDDNKNAAEVPEGSEGVEPFATGQWLIENLRFPTYPNIRWAAVGEDDRPVPGVVYVQYSFAYDSPRPQFGGLSGVGQKVEAVTRHIYYVPEALSAEFEAAFTGLGVSIVETMPEITDPDANVVAEGNKPASGNSSSNTPSTPTYSLLSEQPDDWAQNYTSYYTKSGNDYVPVTGENAPTFEANTYYQVNE